MKTKVILASSSYLKNIIMERSYIPYEKCDPDIDENQFDHFEVNKRVQEIARMKAHAVAKKYKDAFVIAADTLTQDAETQVVYSKPKSEVKQYEQALGISGRTIVNKTGISIFYKGTELKTELTNTEIKYQKFTKITYDRLLKDDHPGRRSSVLGMFTDAAGFTLIESVKGSYTGAMGLPMEIVHSTLDYVLTNEL